MERTRSFVVGYALKYKKQKSFIQPRLVELARDQGIELVEINLKEPLRTQGPFDAILHKLPDEWMDWKSKLEDYQRAHPSTIVIDPPEAIKRLHNRQIMLQDVAELDLHGIPCQIGVPRQLVICDGEKMEIPERVRDAGLRLPLVAKPLWSDGTAKSHDMALAFDDRGLTQIRTPAVLQEFVNHGGVLFKVYVVGDSVRVVRRLSLPDMDGSDLENGYKPFERVSGAEASRDLELKALEPPLKMLQVLAAELRKKLGLSLFNLDIIREKGTSDRYYVIDINYFPGYGKMPGYEEVFVDYLAKLSLRSTQARVTRDSDPSAEASSTLDTLRTSDPACRVGDGGQEVVGRSSVSGDSPEDARSGFPGTTNSPSAVGSELPLDPLPAVHSPSHAYASRPGQGLGMVSLHRTSSGKLSGSGKMTSPRVEAGSPSPTHPQSLSRPNSGGPSSPAHAQVAPLVLTQDMRVMDKHLVAGGSPVTA